MILLIVIVLVVVVSVVLLVFYNIQQKPPPTITDTPPIPPPLTDEEQKIAEDLAETSPPALCAEGLLPPCVSPYIERIYGEDTGDRRACCVFDSSINQEDLNDLLLHVAGQVGLSLALDVAITSVFSRVINAIRGKPMPESTFLRFYNNMVTKMNNLKTSVRNSIANASDFFSGNSARSTRNAFKMLFKNARYGLSARRFYARAAEKMSNVVRIMRSISLRNAMRMGDEIVGVVVNGVVKFGRAAKSLMSPMLIFDLASLALDIWDPRGYNDIEFTRDWHDRERDSFRAYKDDMLNEFGEWPIVIGPLQDIPEATMDELIGFWADADMSARMRPWQADVLDDIITIEEFETNIDALMAEYGPDGEGWTRIMQNICENETDTGEWIDNVCTYNKATCDASYDFENIRNRDTGVDVETNEAVPEEDMSNDTYVEYHDIDSEGNIIRTPGEIATENGKCVVMDPSWRMAKDDAADGALTYNYNVAPFPYTDCEFCHDKGGSWHPLSFSEYQKRKSSTDGAQGCGNSTISQGDLIAVGDCSIPFEQEWIYELLLGTTIYRTLAGWFGAPENQNRPIGSECHADNHCENLRCVDDICRAGHVGDPCQKNSDCDPDFGYCDPMGRVEWNGLSVALGGSVCLEHGLIGNPCQSNSVCGPDQFCHTDLSSLVTLAGTCQSLCLQHTQNCGWKTSFVINNSRVCYNYGMYIFDPPVTIQSVCLKSTYCLYLFDGKFENLIEAYDGTPVDENEYVNPSMDINREVGSMWLQNISELQLFPGVFDPLNVYANMLHGISVEMGYNVLLYYYTQQNPSTGSVVAQYKLDSEGEVWGNDEEVVLTPEQQNNLIFVRLTPRYIFQYNGNNRITNTTDEPLITNVSNLGITRYISYQPDIYRRNEPPSTCRVGDIFTHRVTGRTCECVNGVFQDCTPSDYLVATGEPCIPPNPDSLLYPRNPSGGCLSGVCDEYADQQICLPSNIADGGECTYSSQCVSNLCSDNICVSSDSITCQRSDDCHAVDENTMCHFSSINESGCIDVCTCDNGGTYFREHVERERPEGSGLNLLFANASFGDLPTYCIRNGWNVFDIPSSIRMCLNTSIIHVWSDVGFKDNHRIYPTDFSPDLSILYGGVNSPVGMIGLIIIDPTTYENVVVRSFLVIRTDSQFTTTYTVYDPDGYSIRSIPDQSIQDNGWPSCNFDSGSPRFYYRGESGGDQIDNVNADWDLFEYPIGTFNHPPRPIQMVENFDNRTQHHPVGSPYFLCVPAGFTVSLNGGTAIREYTFMNISDINVTSFRVEDK
jgi:hypothetical protein